MTLLSKLFVFHSYLKRKILADAGGNRATLLQNPASGNIIFSCLNNFKRKRIIKPKANFCRKKEIFVSKS